MDKISLVGSKGGVGTSTVAVLHALSVAESGRRVRLTATAAADVEDLAVLLAVPTPAPGEVIEVAPGLSLGDAGDPDAYTVVDGGTDTFSDHDGPVYLVVRNVIRAVCACDSGISATSERIQPVRTPGARLNGG